MSRAAYAMPCVEAAQAVLISSHLLDRVQSVCDRVALFNHGKIALMGSVVELANQVLGAGHPILVEASGRVRGWWCSTT